MTPLRCWTQLKNASLAAFLEFTRVNQTKQCIDLLSSQLGSELSFTRIAGRKLPRFLKVPYRLCRPALARHLLVKVLKIKKLLAASLSRDTGSVASHGGIEKCCRGCTVKIDQTFVFFAWIKKHGILEAEYFRVIEIIQLNFVNN